MPSQVAAHRIERRGAFVESAGWLLTLTAGPLLAAHTDGPAHVAYALAGVLCFGVVLIGYGRVTCESLRRAYRHPRAR